MKSKEVGRVSIIKFLKGCLRGQGRKERGQQLKGVHGLKEMEDTRIYSNVFRAESEEKKLMNRTRSVRSLEWRWSRGKP